MTRRGCQQTALPLPDGWTLAPDTEDSRKVKSRIFVYNKFGLRSPRNPARGRSPNCNPAHSSLYPSPDYPELVPGLNNIQDLLPP